MDAAEIRRRLADPFPPEVMGWKAQTTTQDKQRALAVAYIDARDVMDRLDDVVGVDGWEDAYAELPNGAVLCTLRLRINDVWIAKQDVGGESDQPDKGDKTKAAHSDALKRTAVKFGIGRYLYSLPAVWCPYDAQKKQLSQTPSLPPWAMPGGSGRPHKTPASPPAPVNAGRAQLPPTGLPESGEELHRRLREYDAKLAAARKATVGALLAHVAKQGSEAGYGSDITTWSGPAIPFAVAAVKAFEAGLTKAA